MNNCAQNVDFYSFLTICSRFFILFDFEGEESLEKIIINGGNRLTGEVEISGAKNAVVAIIPATILAEGVCRIENIPNISDVSAMIKILRSLGAEIKVINKNTLEIDTTHVRTNVVGHDLSKLMRASYYFIASVFVLSTSISRALKLLAQRLLWKKTQWLMLRQKHCLAHRFTSTW